MASIGFIGLGRMGNAMSRQLVEAGHDVWVFDINPAAVNSIAAIGGHAARSAAEAASNRDFVISMLPNGPMSRKPCSAPWSMWPMPWPRPRSIST